MNTHTAYSEQEARQLFAAGILLGVTAAQIQRTLTTTSECVLVNNAFGCGPSGLSTDSQQITNHPDDPASDTETDTTPPLTPQTDDQTTLIITPSN